MGAVLVTGLVTPGEFASIAGLLVLMALIPVALLLRKGDTGSALAVGLAHGIGLIFAFVLLVTLADALLRIVGPGEAIAPLSGRSGVLICLALGIVLGALFGGAVGSVLAALILLVLGGKGSPLTVGYLTVLAALAGGALQPWLSWRLAGRSPPAEAPSFKSALLAALPPALAALALGFFPDLSAVPLQLLD